MEEKIARAEVKKLDEHTWQIAEIRGDMIVYLYLLEGEERAAMIDTGLGYIDLKAEIARLTDKPVFVINTHCHVDHIGNNNFDQIYIGAPDQPGYIREIDGFGPDKIPHEVNRESIPLEDGQTLDLGGRVLKIIATPGHSVGHICILDESHRKIYTGDGFCYGDILLFVKGLGLPVYLQSLQKLLDAGEFYDETWPAHVVTPVTKEMLQELKNLGEDILAGRIEGKRSEGGFFGKVVKVHRGDIGFSYREE